MPLFIMSAFLFLFVACKLLDVVPEPDPSVEPRPSATPQPTEDPLPSPFIVPTVVPVNTPLFIFLCLPYEYNVEVLIDETRVLGTFGKDLQSGCMKLFYPGLTQAGKRTIKAKDYRAEIRAVDFQNSVK